MESAGLSVRTLDGKEVEIDGGHLMTVSEFKEMFGFVPVTKHTLNPRPTMARCADGVTRWK